MSTNVWNFDADRKVRNLYFDWAVTQWCNCPARQWIDWIAALAENRKMCLQLSGALLVSTSGGPVVPTGRRPPGPDGLARAIQGCCCGRATKSRELIAPCSRIHIRRHCLPSGPCPSSACRNAIWSGCSVRGPHRAKWSQIGHRSRFAPSSWRRCSRQERHDAMCRWETSRCSPNRCRCRLACR